jgi:NADH-dependent peroxiredoxin subunit C
MVKIDDEAPGFEVKAFHENEIKEVKLSDYKGKWVVMFFYPGDFTFVCPTELGELADKYGELKGMGVEVLSVSTDSEYVHKAWQDSSDTIKKIKYPMLADTTGNICRNYGTYIEDKGESLRGTFIIDPDGNVKTIEIHHNDVGRNIDELVRKVKAAQHVMNNPGQVCPVNWSGGDTLTKDLKLVGKI